MDGFAIDLSGHDRVEQVVFLAARENAKLLRPAHGHDGTVFHRVGEDQIEFDGAAIGCRDNVARGDQNLKVPPGRTGSAGHEKHSGGHCPEEQLNQTHGGYRAERAVSVVS